MSPDLMDVIVRYGAAREMQSGQAGVLLGQVRAEVDRLRGELGRFVRAMVPGGGLMVQHSCGATDVEPVDGSGPGRCAWCAGEQGDVWLPLYVQTLAATTESVPQASPASGTGTCARPPRPGTTPL